MQASKVAAGRMDWLRLGIVLALAAALFLFDPLFLPSGRFSPLSLLLPPFLVWFALFLGFGILAPAWTAERRAVLAWAVYLLTGLAVAFVAFQLNVDPSLFGFGLYYWPTLLVWIGMCGAGWWCPFN